MAKMSVLQESTLIEQLPGFVLWKNMNSVYLKSNTNMARLLGFKHADELVGVTDHDIRCPAVEYADGFVQSDQKAQNYCSTLVMIDRVIYSGDQVTTLLVNKKIFYDENSGPLGISSQAIELNSTIIQKIDLLFNKDKYFNGTKKTPSRYLNSTYDGIQLSKQQAQCLFYLLHGKSNKTIAKILQLSPRTIETYIENIKAKMGCTNKAQLIEKSINLGFLTIVPPGIISKQMIGLSLG